MSIERDVRLVLVAQALRAFGYGLGSVLLASTLAQRGLSSIGAGVVLGALVAGTVIAQAVIGRWADSYGRRRSYALMYLLLGVAGVVLASNAPLWLLVVVTLTGALSAEVIESGPFTTLELSMLSGRLPSDSLAAGFGWYNAIAAAAGSLGALAAGLPEATRQAWEGAPPDRLWFLVLVPIAATGIVLSRRLSPMVEVTSTTRKSAPLGKSRRAVTRLAALFAVDAFAGGFVVQTLIAFWLIDRFQATTTTVGALLAAVGVVQTLSFLAAPLIARKWGLLNTMVFTHLPSNLLLAAVAFAPSFEIAAGLLLARSALSQMDVPTRQAYVMSLVEAEERTAAIAYTNTARYIVRPIGPLVAGAAISFAAGAPFVIAGTIKSIYDLALWSWFRTIPLTNRKENAIEVDHPRPPQD
ncbi:MAG TPA: MFS transporter [Acidimicrobiia bacterium]|nr:MFS transporter [Acidimicrobiia bacterium]